MTDLPRHVLLNGQIVSSDEATVSVFDRGFLLADSVYEGLGVLDGQIIDYVSHFRRFERSLGHLDLPMADLDTLFALLMELIAADALDEGFLYMQMSRGTADRSFTYQRNMSPTVMAFTQEQRYDGAGAEPTGLRLGSQPDLRWKRRDLKTTNLLAHVLAIQGATDEGYDEALLIEDDGIVTEGGASSFFIVLGEEIVTRPLGPEILPGVTRRAVLDIAASMGIPTTERVVRLEDTYQADESFITGASSYVQPVIEIDDHVIGDGRPGAMALELRQAYIEYARRSFYSPGGA